VQFSGAQLAAAATSPHRLIYATPELTAPVHLSGFSRLTIRVASSKPAANLSVWLVQLPWTEGPIGTANLITRGWADPKNAASLTQGGDYHAKAPGVALTPGRPVTLTFDLEPDDQVIPAGKRIALMLMSSDKDFTLWPAAGTELTVDLAGTSITLPVVGGTDALRKALGGR
jgi:X-Pro dipeptidyl-peptidase